LPYREVFIQGGQASSTWIVQFIVVALLSASSFDHTTPTPGWQPASKVVDGVRGSGTVGNNGGNNSGSAVMAKQRFVMSMEVTFLDN
jgi:hypothetical protein